MTDALSLDLETVASQTAEVQRVRDPWLERRGYGWGASEIASLLLAYDYRREEWADARVYHRDDAAMSRWGVPLCVARKAGLTRGKATSFAMRRGQERERELIETWARESGYDDVTLASTAPREWYPLVDRHCPALTATPDAWCRGPSGEHVVVEAKCTTDHPMRLPWYWRVQVSAQIACMSAACGVLVCGPGWIFDSGAQPVSWLIERNESEIARVRDVARFAWAVVQSVKERQ